MEIGYQFLKLLWHLPFLSSKNTCWKPFFQLKSIFFMKNTKIKQPYLSAITGGFVHHIFLINHINKKVGEYDWVKALPVVNGVRACMMLVSCLQYSENQLGQVQASWAGLEGQPCSQSLSVYIVDPLRYFSFQPVLHDWCNIGRGMCHPVCGMVHIKKTWKE